MAPCHSVQRAVYTQVYRSGLAVHSTSSVRNSRLLPPQGGHGLLRKNDVVVDARLSRVTNRTFCLTKLRGSCLRPLLTKVEGGPQFEFSQIGPYFLWTRTARLLSNLECYSDARQGATTVSTTCRRSPRQSHANHCDLTVFRHQLAPHPGTRSNRDERFS